MQNEREEEREEEREVVEVERRCRFFFFFFFFFPEKREREQKKDSQLREVFYTWFSTSTCSKKTLHEAASFFCISISLFCFGRALKSNGAVKGQNKLFSTFLACFVAADDDFYLGFGVVDWGS
jgi:hypothetical protein